MFKTSLSYIARPYLKAREMAWWFRTCSYREPGLCSQTPLWQLTTVCNSSSRGSNLSSDLCRLLHACATHIYSGIHMKYFKNQINATIKQTSLDILCMAFLIALKTCQKLVNMFSWASNSNYETNPSTQHSGSYTNWPRLEPYSPALFFKCYIVVRSIICGSLKMPSYLCF